MKHDKDSSNKRNYESRLVGVMFLLVSIAGLFCCIHYRQSRTYESYIQHNVKTLKSIFDVVKMNNEQYEQLASKKAILRLDRSNSWLYEYPEAWNYAEYKKEEVERYGDLLKNYYSEESFSGIVHAFYCRKHEDHSAIEIQVFGLETQQQAKTLLTYYKDHMKSHFQSELTTYILGEKYPTIPYAGILETEAYLIYCSVDKGDDSIDYFIIVKEDNPALIHTISFHGYTYDNLFNKFRKYLKKMGLPELEEVEMVEVKSLL